LLAAIAKARGWIEDLRLGRVATLSEIDANVLVNATSAFWRCSPCVALLG
jgi:hypothetical protein